MIRQDRGDYNMLMTKKNFILIANAINCERLDSRNDELTIIKVMERIAQSLKVTNPKFDKDKFYLACGFKTEIKQ